MNTLARMYITLMPAIVAGILNMVWCKAPICKALKKPVDGGKCLSDGKRIFGDNKTWKGFAGMMILGMLCGILWGFACSRSAFLGNNNLFYANFENTLPYNAAAGLLIGFAYALFELPNSFLKRRIGIVPGKALQGAGKVFFVFLDQADSIFGCVLVICIFYRMSVPFYFLYVAVGAVTHIVLNMLLYFCKLRKNMF